MKSAHILMLIAISFLWSCQQDSKWKGQDALKKVDTHTVPIQKQLKGIFDIGDSIYCSNDFDGARLNGVVLTNDTLVTVLITPENTPINKSPWYAFNIWSSRTKDVYLKITYLDGYRHRYYPKLSYDRLSWHNLDSINYSEDIESKAGSERGFPTNITMKLLISQDTTWIAGQEIISSNDVNEWAKSLVTKQFITTSQIGESHEGRPINLLKIGKVDDKKMILILSRQHPPEVTGYLAMQSFVETICGESETATKFREVYNTYVIPNLNPDGVDNGHWRHNAGGVDLNRDWEEFNQPELQAVKRFIEKKIDDGGKFYFAVDFHSTHEDIYYTTNPELEGNMPGLVPDMIENMSKKLNDDKPNIRPASDDEPRVTSKSYLFHELGAESLTFEIGDNTPRRFIKRKGEVAAIELMKLMLKH